MFVYLSENRLFMTLWHQNFDTAIDISQKAEVCHPASVKKIIKPRCLFANFPGKSDWEQHLGVPGLHQK